MYTGVRTEEKLPQKPWHTLLLLFEPLQSLLSQVWRWVMVGAQATGSGQLRPRHLPWLVHRDHCAPISLVIASRLRCFYK